MTNTAPFAVVTATAPGDGIAVGDVSFITSPDGKAKLAALFKEVATACKGKRAKRTGSCELSYLSRPNVGGGVLEFDFPLNITIPAAIAGESAAALSAAPAAVAAAFIAYVVGRGSVPEAVNIPEDQVNSITIPTITAPPSTTPTKPNLAPFVTTNIECVRPTETFDADEAYVAGIFMWETLRSLFPTNTKSLQGPVRVYCGLRSQESHANLQRRKGKSVPSSVQLFLRQHQPQHQNYAVGTPKHIWMAILVQ
ncbi:hypothetical protein FQN50_001425 [Emmonsiellopsis sp. PD_5]|nr:hypothetical protein FQN50_001425 [Emmonsiellopsis sp. PD_5]